MAIDFVGIISLGALTFTDCAGTHPSRRLVLVRGAHSVRPDSHFDRWANSLELPPTPRLRGCPAGRVIRSVALAATRRPARRSLAASPGGSRRSRPPLAMSGPRFRGLALETLVALRNPRTNSSDARGGLGVLLAALAPAAFIHWGLCLTLG
jgi:hypothetical protein